MAKLVVRESAVTHLLSRSTSLAVCSNILLQQRQHTHLLKHLYLLTLPATVIFPRSLSLGHSLLYGEPYMSHLLVATSEHCLTLKHPAKWLALKDILP